MRTTAQLIAGIIFVCGTLALHAAPRALAKQPGAPRSIPQNEQSRAPSSAPSAPQPDRQADQQPPQPSQPEPALAQIPTPTPEQPSFAAFLDGVRAEALTRGIRAEILDQAFAGLDQPLEFPLRQDKAQPELQLTLEDYIARHVSASMIARGRDMMKQHRALLNRVSRAYGVPAGVLVAIWGLESNYGRFSGNQSTIAVLATLAWDPRRSALFRQELFSALEILNRGDIEPDRLRGSWAGALGQPQFLPSSYLSYAVDFDGDSRRDIWQSPADVFASIGNYLQKHGWQAGARWGREVSVKRGAHIETSIDAPLREGGCRAMREMRGPLPLEQWRALGVRLPGGAALPKGDFSASLTSGTSRQFLTYENYDALLSYNCAHTYALSAALLADRLGP